jgi:hypothetical protein
MTRKRAQNGGCTREYILNFRRRSRRRLGGRLPHAVRLIAAPQPRQDGRFGGEGYPEGLRGREACLRAPVGRGVPPRKISVPVLVDFRVTAARYAATILRRFARTRAWRRAVSMRPAGGPRLLFSANFLLFPAF